MSGGQRRQSQTAEQQFSSEQTEFSAERTAARVRRLSFVVGAWRYVHMGRSLAESKIAQVQAWLVLAATLLLFATALIAIGSALLLW
jgi:hypothetical protein